MKKDWFVRHGISGRLFPALLCMVLAVTAAFSAMAQDETEGSTPSVKVQGPKADIPGRIVSSASRYVEINTDDDLYKAPQVLKAAKAAKKEKETGSTDTDDSALLVDMTEDEIYMFASEVYCEAGNESYESQVGVAQVIINRIRSKKFPNTLEGVLYDPGQFPPAVNGFMDRVMASGEGSACRRAVMDALHGADVIGDYLYFNMTSGVDFSQAVSYKTIDGTTFYALNE